MRRRGPRPGGDGRTGWLLRFAVILLGLTVVVGGTALWQYRKAQAAGRPAVSAALGGLDVTAGDARWAAMDAHTMDGPQGGGYQMPAQMMPGAPEDGTMRLGITLTVADRGAEARLLDLGREFTLTGGGVDVALTPHSDTFGPMPRLGPGSAVRGTLYFDLKAPDPGAPPLYLLWNRDGKQRRLIVQLPDSAPEHEHGS
ncbi:hypothetical protein [Kitasatospora sp. NPDC059327]|uniref:hypothetical protein n=1 Tax=Kitasatospora sp. NPDC059327 TaxID=3346803 RepID=UPI0036AA1CA8